MGYDYLAITGGVARCYEGTASALRGNFSLFVLIRPPVISKFGIAVPGQDILPGDVNAIGISSFGYPLNFLEIFLIDVGDEELIAGIDEELPILPGIPICQIPDVLHDLLQL